MPQNNATACLPRARTLGAACTHLVEALAATRVEPGLYHQQEHTVFLEQLRSTVSTVKHEINNPLAIIAGNTQLLCELVQALDPDGELSKPLSDIEEATRRIAASVEKLSGFNEHVGQILARNRAQAQEAYLARYLD